MTDENKVPEPKTDIDYSIEELEKIKKEVLGKNLAGLLAEDIGFQLKSGPLPSCAICDSELALPTTLIGGFNTILCQDDRNAWQEYVSNSAERRSLDSASVRLDIAIRQGKEAEAINLQHGIRQAKKALYFLGKVWIEENKKNG
jgi:hypothetical protein